MKQVRYLCIDAHLNGITNHPVKQMNELGYNIIAVVPQTIADQWWFSVDELIEPLPPYLEVMEYDFEKYHGEVK